jgi:transposase
MSRFNLTDAERAIIAPLLPEAPGHRTRRPSPAASARPLLRSGPQARPRAHPIAASSQSRGPANHRSGPRPGLTHETLWAE